MSDVKNSNIRAGMLAIWRHLQPYKGTLLLLSGLGIISASANGAVPYVTGRFFDALIAVSLGESATAQGLPVWLFFLGIWTGIQLVANNIDWVIDRLRRTVDTKIHMAIQAQGFAHLFRLPMSFHKNVHINEVLEKISKAGWRTSAVVMTVIDISPQLLSIVIGITLAASINVLLAGVLAVGVTLYLVLLLNILRPVAVIDESAHKSWNEGWNDAAAAVQQIESVKQATAEEYESKKTFDVFFNRTFNLWYRMERIWSNVSFFQRTVIFLTQLAVFLISVHFIATGIITVGELVAINGYALMFFGPFASLGNRWQVIQNGLTSALQVEEIFDEEEELYKPVGGKTLRNASGRVAFEHVTFRYDEAQPMVLNDVSFSTEPGEVIALVGESGVGKSTLVQLVSGYFFPSKGIVKVEGVDTHSLNLTSLRKQIAIVPQEVALFNDTIYANIRYGAFSASEKEVITAAQRAHAHDFIEKFPNKYKQIVGERGIKLSVGQKQRIAIARAILRGPKILILDEPTSALDARTEQLITESLEELMQGRTTFIIAHRLSTVRKADKILVFEKGKIVEQGKHDELIQRRDGAYRRLYE
ncbi:MAG TPA: ABC transporter ATP-binding protein, partial [Candidatus Paceibacterota bacterium]